MKLRITAFLIITCAVLASCNVTAPTVSDLKDPRLVAGRKGELGVEAQIKINNPNKHVIRVKKLKLDVFMDDELVGTAKSGKKIRIKPFSDEYYTISLETDMKELGTTGMNMLKGYLTGSGGNFRLKGYGVAGVGIFSRRFEIDHMEKMRLDGFSW